MMDEPVATQRASDGNADNCCYLCNQCSSSFASLEELETHLASHAADMEGVRSRRADENSPSSSETSFHIDETLQATPASHEGDPEEEEPMSPMESEPGTDGDGKRPFPCRFCNKLFTSRSLLNIHYTHTHRDKPQYECEDCGRIFSVKRELATHRRIHSGEQTHSCAQCGKEFGTRQLLKKHWMWHTGQRSHVCPHCGKAFFQKGHLTQHLMIHAGGRPHVCQLCSKTFIFKFDLNRHMKIHAERGYSCSKCGKAFLKEATLVDHQPKCTGERTTPSPSPSVRSPARSVPSTPERKHSTPSLVPLSGKSEQPSPLSTQPLPLFPPQLLQPPGSEAQGVIPGGGAQQRIVCLLCMQDFPSQAAYSLHLSYVHLRDAMFNSFQQQQAGGAPPSDPLKNPSPVVSMISALSQQQQLLRQSSPVIRRASDSAVLNHQSGPKFLQPPPVSAQEPQPMENGHHHNGNDGDRSSESGRGGEGEEGRGEAVAREPKREPAEKGSEEGGEGSDDEAEEDERHLVPGCPGCAHSRPRLAQARTRLKELQASLVDRDSELVRMRGKMHRVGLIAGSLLESCSEFDKLWMLHSKKVYSQIQSVLNSLD